jgi:steroid delta-isomerase-like uncharacterized protein
MTANRKLLDYYVERYNAGDLDAVMDLYAEDAVQLMPDGMFEGRSTIRERLARELNGFSDVAHRVESFVEQGDAFADEWTFVGTHTGPLALPDGSRLPPTGNHVEVRGMEFVQMRDGKIVVDNLYYDTTAVVAQLGGLPPQPRDTNGATPALFEVAARLKVRDGELDGFKQQAAEMMRQTRENDTKTLRYDWFLSNDETTVEVREGYVDADGLLEHARNVQDAREKLFSDFAYDHDMTIYGEPSPALAALMEKLAGHVEFNRFALLQGLDVDIEARDKVPA